MNLIQQQAVLPSHACIYHSTKKGEVADCVSVWASLILFSLVNRPLWKPFMKIFTSHEEYDGTARAVGTAVADAVAVDAAVAAAFSNARFFIYLSAQEMAREPIHMSWEELFLCACPLDTSVSMYVKKNMNTYNPKLARFVQCRFFQ